ncbi:MAG: Zinc ribbon domain protein [Syntrophaceae bacterium PtaU1.Bin231]|nr:MAG: Zinc ribbon domain protein [Syntrophaceae bacterium PtaU1.Bin231]HOG16221.1 zinc ribbon domain-containing protein [Syntrophales bacterium]
MPIYEYKCRKCGKEFEQFQKITDSPLKSCKFCKGPVGKLISMSSFHLKGSGWYVTDYGGKKAPASETKATPPSAEKKETKTESKTAAKKDE